VESGTRPFGRTVRGLVAAVAGLALVWISMPAVGQDAAPTNPPPAGETAAPPSAADRLTAARESLDRARSGSDEAKIRSATSLVEILEAIIAAETRLTEFQRTIDTAEQARTQAAQRLAGIDPRLESTDVRARVQELELKVAALGDETAAITAGLDRREVRRAAMRAEVTALNERIAQVEGAASTDLEHRDAQIERLRAEIRAIELERRAYDATDDILRDRQRAVARESDTVEAALEAWRAHATAMEAREAEARRAAADAIARAQSDPIAGDVAARNRELAERLTKVSGEDARLTAILASREAMLDRVRRGLEADRRRFAGRVTPAIATVLRQRDAALPSEIELQQQIARLRETLPEIELERLLLEDELARLTDAAVEADRLIDASADPVPESERPLLRRTLIDLLDIRVTEHAQPLLRSLNTRVDELNGIIETDQALLEEIDRYRDFVLQQTVWVRDPSALAPGFGRRLADQAAVFFAPEGWREVRQAMLADLAQRPILAVLAVLPGLLLVLLRRPIARRTALAGDRVARAATDRFRETLVVTGFAILQGLAITAPILALDIALGDDPLGSRMVIALDHTLTRLAVFTFVLATLAAVIRPGGLAERHFRWSSSTIRLARRFVVLAGIAVVFAACDRMCAPRELALPDLGRVFYTPMPLLIATVLVLTLRMRDDGTTPGRTHLPTGSTAHTLLAMAVVLPLAGAVLANVGWYDATSLLQRASVTSLLYLASLFVFRELLYRGLHSRQRQESWRLRRQREGGEDVADEVEDLAAIGARTASAIRFCMIGLLLAGVWVIWRDLFPAFQGFQGFQLWEHEAMVPSGDDGRMEPTLLPVTLGDLLLAIGTFLATISASRHLPTLIEVVVLDRFGLERGVRYAVVQLTQWLVLIAGTVVGFSLIGVTWSSVQWLAAGFTVGLGFGLQEIFANFISGLIILFEQPVRVGDIVTVGTTTGRISRVRMRSTTITDWDRKELIVPNKQFITQEVVNWSLGDSCIRLVIPVGVSYDDDPETVTGILLGIGRADPETLDDPEPHVFFAGFGESSLDFELRVFLDGTDGLITVRNRLNTAIKKAFDEADITIPFPQRDVHLSPAAPAAHAELVPRDDPDRGPKAPVPISPPTTAADHPKTDPPTTAES